MVNETIADPVALANDLRPILLRLSRELRKETEDLGVTGRQVTLLWLIRNHPGLSLRELAAEERISAPALSGHVDRLEKAGLIERAPDPNDRRGTLIELTPKGLELIDRVTPAHLENERNLIASLSGAEQATLIELLRKLRLGLSP